MIFCCLERNIDGIVHGVQVKGVTNFFMTMRGQCHQHRHQIGCGRRILAANNLRCARLTEQVAAAVSSRDVPGSRPANGVALDFHD